MYSKKAGETLNVPKDEGQVVINVIKKELPQTIAMVEAATAAATKQGYVILNYRTNSRAWFPCLIKQIKGEMNKEEHFIDISMEESAARNIRIQGTQADFVKEATVVLGTYYRKRKLKAKMIMWIHDEIVDKVADELLEEFNPNIDVTQFPRNCTQIRGVKKKDQVIKPKEFYRDVAHIKDHIMTSVANKYLHNVTIGVDHETAQHWVK